MIIVLLIAIGSAIMALGGQGWGWWVVFAVALLCVFRVGRPAERQAPNVIINDGGKAYRRAQRHYAIRSELVTKVSRENAKPITQRDVRVNNTPATPEEIKWMKEG